MNFEPIVRDYGVFASVSLIMCHNLWKCTKVQLAIHAIAKGYILSFDSTEIKFNTCRIFDLLFTP